MQGLVKKISEHSRLAGSEGEQKALDFIKGHLQKSIGGKLNFQKFKFLAWSEKKGSDFFCGEEKIPCKTVYYSPSGRFQGKLEYFGKNDDEDDNPFEVFAIKNSKKDILALIYVSIRFSKPFFYNTGNLGYLIPSAIVGSEYLDLIRSNVGKEASFSCSGKISIKYDHNLIHKISNRKGKFKLVLGAHVDTIPYFKGALDNASGVAALMMLSEKVSSLKLPFDVWAVYFCAEENSMIGSKYFVDMLSENDREKIKFMISIDGTGLGDRVVVFSDKDYFPQVEKAFSKIGDSLDIFNMEKSLDYSDHYYFSLSGIDCAFFSGETGDYYCHNQEAGKKENMNTDLAIKALEGTLNFVKNIQFKTPDIDFKSRRTRKNLIKKALRLIFQ